MEKHKEDIQAVKLDYDNKANRKFITAYFVNDISIAIISDPKGRLLAETAFYQTEDRLEPLFASAVSFEKEIQMMTDKEITDKIKGFIKEENFHSTLPYLAHLLEKNTEDKMLLTELAHVYFEEELSQWNPIRNATVRRLYEKLLGSKEFREDLQSQYEYACSLFRTHDYPARQKDVTKAHEILNGIEKKDPDYPGLHYVRGEMLLRSVGEKEAKKEFELEFSKHPSHLPTISRLIELYYGERKWDEVIGLVKLFVKVSNPVYGLNLPRVFGWLYLLNGDLKMALREYKKSTFTGYYSDYAEVLEFLREEEKAKEVYEKALSGAPGDTDVIRARKALERLKRWNGKRKITAFLGIQAVTLKSENAKVYGLLAGTEGVFIQRLYTNTQADYAGLKAGDVLQKINGKAIASTKDYHAFMQEAKLADLLTFEILRNGKTKTFFLRYIPPSLPHNVYYGYSFHFPYSPYLKSRHFTEEYHHEISKKLKTKNTKSLILRYFSDAKETEQRLLEIEKSFNEALSAVGKFFKIPPKHKFYLLVYPSVLQYGNETGDYTEGFAMYVADNPYLKETLIRLSANALYHRESGYYLEGFYQGIGGFIAGTYQGKDIDELAKKAFEENKVVSIQDVISEEDFIAYEIEVSIPVTSSFVKYLVEDYGWETFQKFMKNISNFGIIADQFKDSFKEPFEDVERKWLEKIQVQLVSTK